MNMTPLVGNGHTPPELMHPDKAAMYEDLLWGEADNATATAADLQAEMDGLYAALHTPLTARERMRQEGQRAADENRYWQMDAERRELEDRADRIITVLERLTDGIATVEEVTDLLPSPEPEEAEGKDLKKSGNAFDYKNSYGAMLDSEPWASPDRVSRTDPRRLATGRNRKKLNASGRVTELDASDRFYHVTTDTHGGKVRAGKKGEYYVGASGKRIRKK